MAVATCRGDEHLKTSDLAEQGSIPPTYSDLGTLEQRQNERCHSPRRSTTRYSQTSNAPLKTPQALPQACKIRRMDHTKLSSFDNWSVAVGLSRGVLHAVTINLPNSWVQRNKEPLSLHDGL